MKFERKANDYADYTRKIIRSFGILLDTKTQLYNGALYNCVYTSAKCKYQKSSGWTTFYLDLISWDNNIETYQIKYHYGVDLSIKNIERLEREYKLKRILNEK